VSARGTTTDIGRRAEGRAVELLRASGYRIAGRNVRTAGGELDVVAWDGDVLCFVEVRCRRSARHGGPAATVDRKKQARVARAASAYLERLEGAPPRCRFDVVAVLGGARSGEARLVRGAFGGFS
jgi:putative endonuclease